MATARLARGRVIRPIRIFGATAIAGAVAAPFGLLGAVPRAFLAMAAAVALAFAVNRRPTRRPRRPALRRLLWIGAAALMLAAIPSDLPRGAGAAAFSISEIDLAVAAAIGVALIIALVRIVQGIRADRGDRLLVGVVAGILAFIVLFVRIPPPAPVWIYPFAVLVGAALARARGNRACV